MRNGVANVDELPMTFIAHKGIQSHGMGKSTRGGGTFIGFPRMESGDNPSRQTIPNVSSS